MSRTARGLLTPDGVSWPPSSIRNGNAYASPCCGNVMDGVVSSVLLWKNTALGDGMPPRTAALAADDAYALTGRLA